MKGKITYHQQVSYCGKTRCQKCQEGIGHGPYWYAYQTINGQIMRTYIGKHLPPEVQAEQERTKNEQDAQAVELFRVYTLGQFRVERLIGGEWQPITSRIWHKIRIRMLFAFLICSPARRVSRSGILTALWPKRARESASNELNKLLYSLRRLLGYAQTNMSRVLLRSEGDSLVLADQAIIWVDADAMDSALRLSEDHPPPERLQFLREVANLYGGDFLPEGRISWVLTRRQSVRRSWIALLLVLADLSIEQQEMTIAIDALNRLLANDPSNEAGTQRLIRVLAHLKRRGEALRVYSHLVEVLQREYQARPSSETTALYEEIRAGKSHELFTSSTIVVPATEPSPSTEVSFIDDWSSLFHEAAIGRNNQTPLVGREQELIVLQRLLLEVNTHVRMQVAGQRGALPLDTQRRPQSLMLLGEPGIGKTRLAEELSRYAQQNGWSIIWSRAYQQESTMPYRIWSEALRPILQLREELSMSRQGGEEQTLWHVSPQETLQTLAYLLPELALQIPVPEAYLHLTPEQEQTRLREAVRDLFRRISEQAPLLVVLDDIQWADHSSCELYAYLSRQLSGYPICFLATCRDGDLTEKHPLQQEVAHMQREHAVSTLTITPLSIEQIAMLVRGLSPLPGSIIRYIQRYAGGNPLFAEELARTTPPAVPKTISMALEQRLRTLSKSCQQMLSTASILGGAFEIPLIENLEGLDEDGLLNLLEEALQAGVLTEEGRGTQITYHFWHPLLVTHLYERISALRRARLHLKAAKALQYLAQGQEETVAATIAQHFLRADASPLKIIYYAELAGDYAYSVSAYGDAAESYRLALDFAKSAFENIKEIEYAETELARTDNPAHSHPVKHLLYLQERLAECLTVQGKFAETHEIYENMLHMRETIKEAQEVKHNDEVQVQAVLWSELGWIWRYLGENERGQQCYERGIALLGEVGIEKSLAWARLLYLQSSLLWQEGKYEDAQRITREIFQIYEKHTLSRNQTAWPSAYTTRHQRILLGDRADLARLYRRMGALEQSRGNQETSFSFLEEAWKLYERYGYQRETAHISCDVGYVSLKLGRLVEAEEHLQRAWQLAEKLGDVPLQAIISFDYGEIALGRGQLSEAERWYRQALEYIEPSNDKQYLSLWNSVLATLLAEEKNWEEARKHLWQGWKVGREIGNNPCLGVSLLALGMIRWRQAETHNYARAVRLNRASNHFRRVLALPGQEIETQIRATIGLGLVEQAKGADQVARNLLQAALEQATEQKHLLLAQWIQNLLDRKPAR